jgi:predicted amidohydrolase YtcJ
MRGSILWCVGVVISLVVAPGPVSAQAQVPPELLAYPNLVIVNGKVLTVDQQFTTAEAVAIRDGRVLAVGTNDQIRRLVGPSTRVVDAGGKSVVPGFIDSDGDNAFAGGDLYKDTMVNGVVGTKVRDDSVAGMLRQVSALVAKANAGSPVWVRMADEWQHQLSKLTAKDLDALAPNNPLSLALSSSEGVVNTLMLNRAFAAGLPRDHIGVIKDASGQPTGQLFGAAIGMVGWNLRDWPELTDAIYDAQLKINNQFLQAGVTTVTGHASGYTVTVMSQLYHQGRLALRIRPDLDFARQNPLAAQFLRRTPNLVDFQLGDGMMRVVGAAVGPVDGASDDGGILTNAPKAQIHPTVGGAPNGTNKWLGSSFTGWQWTNLSPAQQMQTEAGTLFLMRKHGWNIGGNHNMGSQAASIVLETLAAAEKQPDIKVKNMIGRNALDHNLIWDQKSIGLAKSMGDKVTYGLNAELWSPRVVRGDEMLPAQYGEGLNTLQPVRDLLNAGIRVHFEGGKPDEPPMWRAQRFITRTQRYATRAERGSAASGQIVWGKQHAVDRKEALRLLTIEAAFFINEEKMLGSIEKGKYADMVVLSGDYMTVAENEIEKLEPVMTIVGGAVVYERK